MSDNIESKELGDQANTQPARTATADRTSPGISLQPTGASRPHTVAQSQIRFDESTAVASYANFCRVTGTPEELIIDFALNPQPFGTPSEPIQISQRLIVNFYTAKRILAALSMTLQRHEGAFDVLETDVQKRGLPAAMRQRSNGYGLVKPTDLDDQDRSVDSFVLIAANDRLVC